LFQTFFKALNKRKMLKCNYILITLGNTISENKGLDCTNGNNNIESRFPINLIDEGNYYIRVYKPHRKPQSLELFEINFRELWPKF